MRKLVNFRFIRHLAEGSRQQVSGAGVRRVAQFTIMAMLAQAALAGCGEKTPQPLPDAKPDSATLAQNARQEVLARKDSAIKYFYSGIHKLDEADLSTDAGRARYVEADIELDHVREFDSNLYAQTKRPRAEYWLKWTLRQAQAGDFQTAFLNFNEAMGYDSTLRAAGDSLVLPYKASILKLQFELLDSLIADSDIFLFDRSAEGILRFDYTQAGPIEGYRLRCRFNSFLMNMGRQMEWYSVMNEDYTQGAWEDLAEIKRIGPNSWQYAKSKALMGNELFGELKRAIEEQEQNLQHYADKIGEMAPGRKGEAQKIVDYENARRKADEKGLKTN